MDNKMFFVLIAAAAFAGFAAAEATAPTLYIDPGDFDKTLVPDLDLSASVDNVVLGVDYATIEYSYDYISPIVEERTGKKLFELTREKSSFDMKLTEYLSCFNNGTKKSACIAILQVQEAGMVQHEVRKQRNALAKFQTAIDTGLTPDDLMIHPDLLVIGGTPLSGFAK
jgi:hypothetical protein